MILLLLDVNLIDWLFCLCYEFRFAVAFGWFGCGWLFVACILTFVCWIGFGLSCLLLLDLCCWFTGLAWFVDVCLILVFYFRFIDLGFDVNFWFCLLFIGICVFIEGVYVLFVLDIGLRAFVGWCVDITVM